MKPGPKPIAWDWILDRDRQFIPIRWERRRSDDAGELEKIPHAVLSTEWEKRNDVWVPVAMDYSASSPGNPRIEFELDWQAVNEPIAPATFTMEGFQLPPGAWIIDKRLGRPIIEGQIAPEAEQTPTPAKASTKSAPRLRRWMIVIANVVLIFGAVFFSLIYRRKTRPQNEVPPVDV